ncbi:DUF2790 domain-containing protein [Pseudomonas sp. GD03842]|uniref:DUF2790 domain-containing protein n=1 Tax=Pseudomonas sp. GD03842 TaxID=2975385 RepID=UPI00244CECBD|nr:DUF2790 domain-containing protein [Pseudomonas sp. GD03842]MDH0746963.1 DUF2790 domain-containing protein [Pseudomonas sp. GD03842]
MKTSITLIALLGFSAAAMAQEGAVSAQAQQPIVEQYSYVTHLDVAKVIAEDQVPDVCGVVPMHMTYQGSQGKRHTLAYQVMGNGCSNG